jgi:antitoxin (DNA-binding transcriptional repressor) of toxin-antitoxin stability system
MKTVKIHEAKTYLSRLLESMTHSESFIISKSGMPIAKLVPCSETPPQRISFMEGQFEVPDDIDTPFRKDIQEMFYIFELMLRL